MNMTKALEPHAELINLRGRRNGHELSSWYQATVVLEHTPEEVANVINAGAKLMVKCASCDAWAALLNEAGVSCNSGGFDKPCPGPERMNAA